MTWTLILFLLLLGLVLLVLEILVIPGSTIVGILGFAAMVFAIFQAYISHGAVAGHLTLASCLVSAVVVLYFALKARTWNRFMLKTNIESKVNVREEGKLTVGEEGLTISRLNPMGKAQFGEEYYEVNTLGDFIDQDTAVVIIKLEANKIYVKQKE